MAEKELHRIRTKEGVLELQGSLNNVWHLVAFCSEMDDGIGALLDGVDPLLRHAYLVEGSVPAADKPKLMLKLEKKLEREYQTAERIPDRLLRVLDGITLDFSTYSATYHRKRRGVMSRFK
jgi:hypothetical protein